MKQLFKLMLHVVAMMSPLLSHASQAGAGSELEGNSVEAVRDGGGRAVIFFKAKHRVDFDAAMGDHVAHYHGVYSVKDGQLCFDIKGAGDCWRYTGPLELDKPQKLSSVGKDTSTAVYTLRSGASAKMPAPASAH